jgi:uracil-DNA glycosylase
MLSINKIRKHQKALSQCQLCKDMIQPVVVCAPIVSKILLVGQAPGDKEGALGKPFAWTAGKTLFKWFSSIGMEEDKFRENVYMSAVCRCFPGKNPKGGDRVPSEKEIGTCAQWVNAEIDLLQPDLLIPVGKLAIKQYIEVDKLVDVIGKTIRKNVNGHRMDIIPLPHPSGASTWHRMQPGKSLLEDALKVIAKHVSWKQLI